VSSTTEIKLAKYQATALAQLRMRLSSVMFHYQDQ